MKIDPNITHPDFITKKWKLLWIDREHYDDYSSARNCKRLVGTNGKFWGYSDSEKLQDNGEEF